MKQRVKIKDSYSIVYGITQGSILGSLLFNIYLADLFIKIPNIEFGSYADDNTSFITPTLIDEVIRTLEANTNILIKWFQNNFMKANPNKCHLLLSSNSKSKAHIGDSNIENSNREKLLSVTIDYKFSFKDHVNNKCLKATQKLNVLARISSNMSLEKGRILFQSFILSQFVYCPLL